MADTDDLRQQVEASLTALYGTEETDEKSLHRGRVVATDGEVNKFQWTALRGMVRRKADEAPAQRPDELDGSPVRPEAPPLPEVPPELAGDVPTEDEDFVPRVDLVGEIKRVHGIEAAVRRWGKPQAALKVGSRTEGIHVRCPFPAHVDNNPSAWINTTKDTWFCGSCQVGGDQIDFYAAARHGISPDTFHGKDQFRPILIEMAQLLGIDTEPPPESPPHHDPEPDPEPPAPSAPSAPPAVAAGRCDGNHAAPACDDPKCWRNDPPEPLTVEQTVAGIDLDNLAWDTKDSIDPLEARDYPTFDWKNLAFPTDTFLHKWMVQNTKDLGWLPPEYFLMLGFQAIGIACGHHQYSSVRGMSTTGSMGLILIGPSGMGKSTAAGRLKWLFRSVTASRWDPDLGSGVRIFDTPASSEALVQAIRHDIEDPGDPTRKIETPTTAYMYDDEFATFVSKTKRRGGEHMKQRLIALYDFAKTTTDPELSIVDNTVTRGTSQLHDSFFSVTFCTQNEVIRRQIEEHDMLSGFMNRLIPVFGRPLRPESPWDEIDPDPEYAASWARLWNRLRGKTLLTQLPVSEKAKELLKTDPYMRQLIGFGQMDEMSLLARLKQHMHQIAFLLAVNEAADEISVRHYELALFFARNYLQKCYASFFAAAKATATKDMTSRMLVWVHDFYDRTREWPTMSEISRQRFWKNATELERKISFEALQLNQEAAQIHLRGRTGRSKTVLIATDRDDSWGRNYSGIWNKAYDEDGFYANA